MDVFDLVAKIRLDSSEYESGVGKAKGTFSSLASGVGKGLATVAKVGAAAVGAAATGITALTKMGVEGYAQYEQLTGGIATMFEDLSWDVEQYANNAYKAAGMSANQYMETVMGFSASLTQSLKASEGDISRAADLADQTITDMADNANKMGTSIEMIQNAYSGFAKGNFTMLDNLKLGYGGTQEEMKRLLADAEKISGIKYDISSFADISEAIHVMQTEMGIAGTTANEASTTIEGSLASMKSAWENLVVGMADENANMDVLMNNFVESTAIAAENLIPRISQTLQGIGQLITELSPVIAEAPPVLVEEVLPVLLEAAVSLVTALINGIITALPALGTALLDGVTLILTNVFGVSEENANKFASGVTKAFTFIKDGFFDMVESAQTEGTWLNEIWTGLQNAAQLFGDFLVALWDALSAAFTWCVEQINTEGTFLNTIWESIKTFITAAVSVIQGVIKAFTAVLRGDWSAAWEACKNIASTVWGAITSIISDIVTWISGFLGEMVAKGTELIQSLQEGIANKFAELFTLVSGWVTDNIITPITDMGTDLYNSGVKIINQFWDGMKNVWNSIVEWWEGLFLSDKEAPSVSGGDGDGYATGLNYVPYDEFPAILHRGEAVLTAAEARIWRRGGFAGSGGGGGGIVINQYIQSVPQTPVELANTTEAYFEQARWML